jgi:DNA-binding helix-hairpin-helix protein with protein kinase domain
MSQPDIAASSLRLGEKLGSGGQGEVHRVMSPKGMAYKRYFSPAVNADSLRALVQFPDSLDSFARTELLTQTAWPQRRVTDAGRVVGFLMQEVPARFLGRTTAGPKLRELQYLLYPPKPMWGDITPLSPADRVQLASALVRLVRTLHSHSMVLGDISMSNLLWSPGQPPQIFILDCPSRKPPAGRIRASPPAAWTWTPTATRWRWPWGGSWPAARSSAPARR